MRKTGYLAALCLLFGASVAFAQGTPADHEALRRLKDDVLAAINKRNVGAMDTLLHRPFMATLITSDSFAELDKLKAHFESLFTRDTLRIQRLTMEAEADELAQIYQGTFAVARGGTKELYELADGRSFDIRGRWTATVVKEDGGWKLLAVHDSTNFLDNPVINRLEQAINYFAAGGLAIGAAVGFLLGFLTCRRRRRIAA